jgi:hypothetical protein
MLPSSMKRKSSTTTAPSEQAPDLSITADDHVHLHIAGYNESPERGLLHSMARFRSSPLDFIREVSLHVSGTGWRSYDNIVGQPIFYSGFSEEMKARILNSPMLVSKVRELASRRVDVEAKEGLLGEEVRKGVEGVGEKDRKLSRRIRIEESLLEVADTMTDNMICKMESKSFIRSAYYLATQLLTRAYHQGGLFVLRKETLGGRCADVVLGVHVSSEEVLRLRSVAQEAARKKQSIIFLPCHRSHVDYV